MKQFLFILSVLGLFAISAQAQCYDQSISQAQSAASSGDYDRAIKVLQTALSTCPDVKNDASKKSKINSLISNYQNKKKREQDNPPREKVESQQYLKLDGSSSNRTKNYSSSSGSEFFNISCSGSYIVELLPSWCSVSDKSSNGFRLNYTENTKTISRSDWFKISGAGKSIRVNVTQSGKQNTESAKVDNVSVSHHESVQSADGMTLRMKLNVNGLKDKNVKVVAYFYDSQNKPLKDTNGNYSTTDGKVSTSIDVKPSYDNSVYKELTLSIPYSELHLSTNGSQNVKYTIGVFRMDGSSSKQLLSTDYYSTNFSFDASTLKIDGSTEAKSVSFYSSGGRQTYKVSTSDASFTTWGVPSWCTIENKTSTGFTLVCNRNYNTTARSDYMEVRAAGKSIRISISQYAAASSTSTSTSTSSSSYRYRRPFNSPRSDAPISGFSVGYVSKQWAYKAGGEIHKWGIWEDSKNVSGLQMGFRIEPLFKYGFGINTGLFYELYYTKTDELSLSEGRFDGKLTEHSLYLPIHLEYRLHFSRNFQLFFYGGAGLDYGLGGSLTITDPSEYYEEYETNDLYDSGDWFNNWKRFNASLEYGAGFRAGPLQFQFQMSKGLTNMSDDNDYKVFQNKNAMATMSIMF